MPGQSFSPPRGMRDIDPEEMAKREYVCGKIKDVLSLFGYQLIDPTHVEKIETIFAKAGPEIEKEIYSFEDKAGRRLALRFDLTVGMARMVANNPDWPKPLRLAAISNVWRYDEPQFGRYRSVFQWDIELFGTNNPAADAEVVQTSAMLLETLGLETYEICVSDRQIMDSFIASLGKKEISAEILRVMDKRGKITDEQMVALLSELGLRDAEIDEVIQFTSKRGSIFEVCSYLREMPALRDQPAVDRMEKIGTLLEPSMDLERIVFDLSIVRGLDYYTGFVFEGFDTEQRELGAVFGGGRFDELVGLYGRPCPAVGCAGGITRLILSLESKGLIPPDVVPRPEVYVAPVTDGEMPQAMAIATDLRKRGQSVLVEVSGRRLRKAMESADRCGCRYIVIVGRSDLESGMVTVRDLESGEEKKVRLGEVASVTCRSR